MNYMAGQKVIPSAHLLELFMPYRTDEKRMLNVAQKTAELGFYRGLELNIFFDRYNSMYIRDFLQGNNIRGATFATPYLKERALSLCSADGDIRKKSVNFTIELMQKAAENGYKSFGVVSGDDPGDAKRKEALKVLADSLGQLAERCKALEMNLTLEPLDRYAYKKQLIGPMKETTMWFEAVHEAHPNTYIHWDSAHEALSQIDLMLSLEYVRPYLAQLHLCNAILDTAHPCYGDLHMDVGVAPDFRTDGFLSPQVGAQILRKVASFDKAAGVEETYVSVEVLGHPGDDLWLKEKNSREFLQSCFKLADLEI